MEMKDILEKSLAISLNNKFNVRIFENYPIIEKEMTYLELGQYLISRNESIDIIDIYIKKD